MVPEHGKWVFVQRGSAQISSKKKCSGGMRDRSLRLQTSGDGFDIPFLRSSRDPLADDAQADGVTPCSIAQLYLLDGRGEAQLSDSQSDTSKLLHNLQIMC